MIKKIIKWWRHRNCRHKLGACGILNAEEIRETWLNLPKDLEPLCSGCIDQARIKNENLPPSIANHARRHTCMKEFVGTECLEHGKDCKGITCGGGIKFNYKR